MVIFLNTRSLNLADTNIRQMCPNNVTGVVTQRLRVGPVTYNTAFTPTIRSCNRKK